MQWLRSALTWLAIVVATAAFGIPSIFAALVPPRGDWYLLFARGWARTILRVAGVRVSVTGAERLAGTSGGLYFSNHESAFDIFVLLAVLPGPLRFMAKRSLFLVPVLGWSMAAAGFIPVVRGHRKKAARSLAAAERRLREGKRVILFPEQTRTRTGELLPFKKGGAVLAMRSGMPIFPVAIAGTFSIQRKGGFLLTPGPAVVAIGEPIATAGRRRAGIDALLAESREAVERLRAEARGRLAPPSGPIRV